MQMHSNLSKRMIYFTSLYRVILCFGCIYVIVVHIRPVSSLDLIILGVQTTSSNPVTFNLGVL